MREHNCNMWQEERKRRGLVGTLSIAKRCGVTAAVSRLVKLNLLLG